MAPKKGSARDRTQQFLASVGTAGGPIGSEGLVTFGATDLVNQVQSGNIDQYAVMRAADGGMIVGQPGAQPPAMPRDLDGSYLKLNLPGSPLPRLGLLAPQLQNAAEMTQNQIIANEQYMMAAARPQTGLLPVGLEMPMANKKRSK